MATMVDNSSQTHSTLEDDAQYLISKAVTSGLDVFYVTNNLTNKETAYFGTNLGKNFLDERRSLLIDFYQFCLMNYKAENKENRIDTQPNPRQEDLILQEFENLPENSSATIVDQGVDNVDDSEEALLNQNLTNSEEQTDQIDATISDQQVYTNGDDENSDDNGNGDDDDGILIPKAETSKDGTEGNSSSGHVPLNVIYYEQICTVCQKQFKSAEYLKRHMELHSKCAYHCPVCDKPFAAKRYIYSHMKKFHKQQFSADIEVPVREFKDVEKADKAQKLLTPSRNKNQEIVHQCNVCPKQFTNSLSLENHYLDCHRMDIADGTSSPDKIKRRKKKKRLTDEEEKKEFICKECGQEFKEAIYLKHHMELHQNKSFKCPVCSKTFGAERYIYSHMASVHKQKYCRSENDKIVSSIEDGDVDSTSETKSLPSQQTAACEEQHSDEHNTRSNRPKRSHRDSSNLQNTPAKNENTSPTSGMSLRSSKRKRKPKSWFDDIVPLDVKPDKDDDFEPTAKRSKKESKRKSAETVRVDNGISSTPKNIKSEVTEEPQPEMALQKKKKCLEIRKNTSRMAFNRASNIELLAGKCQEIAIKGRTYYKCLLCKTILKLRTTAIRHLKQHEDSKVGKFSCRICGMKFMTKFKLGNHLRGIHKQLNAYQCDKCSQKFSGRKYYLQHVEICDAKGNENVKKEGEEKEGNPESSEASVKLQNYTCDLCSYAFYDPVSLEDHFKVHLTDDQSLRCPYCDEIFVDKAQIKQHMLKEHKKRVNINIAQQKHHMSANPLQCCWCMKILSSNETLEKHLKLHENPQLSCPVCKKKFHYEYQVRNHAQLHGEEYNYPCDLCDKKFKLERYLRKHKKDVHDSYKKVDPLAPMCKLCDFVYEIRSDLLEHAKECHKDVITSLLNTKKKICHPDGTVSPIHTCRRCQKQFEKYDDFAVHITNHKPQQPLVCEVCGRTFTVKSNLDNHRLTHGDEKPFSCPSCPKKFKSKSSLYTHKILHHKETQGCMCETCGMHFKLKSSLKKHMRVHNAEGKYKCEVCGSVCRSSDGYKIHVMANHMELAVQKKWKIHECEYCGKKMAMSQQYLRHITKHTGVKPFQCPHCELFFPTKGSLNSHIRRIHTDSEKIYNCSICSVKFAEASKMRRHLESAKHLEACIKQGVDHKAIASSFHEMTKTRYKGQRRSRIKTEMDMSYLPIVSDELPVDEKVEQPGEMEAEEEDEEELMEEEQEEECENEVKQTVKQVDTSWMWKDSTVRQQTEILQQILDDAGGSQSQVVVDGTLGQQQITVEECTEQSGENCEVECYVIRLPENSMFTVV